MDTISAKYAKIRFGPNYSYSKTYAVGEKIQPEYGDIREMDTVESITINDRLGQFKVEVELERGGTLMYVNCQLSPIELDKD